MLRRRVLPVAFALAVTGAAVAFGWKPPPQAPVLDESSLAASVRPIAAADVPRSIDELRERIAAVLASEGVPGVGIALVGRDGPIWIGGVGVADLATRKAVTGDTVFRVASITKSFVGLGVMKLVEQGRLDLDRPLREILTDVPIVNAWDDIAPVTLGQVLEHTAGLDDMRFNEVFTAGDAMTPTAALAINPRSRIIRWRPGTRGAYSNVGYTLAGRAIEVATGEPFDAWLHREILVPLGMPEADFRRTEGLAARLATGYVDRDRPAHFSPIAHRPAGALLASATDLAKLVQFWLRRGDGFPQIVSPAGLDRIERAGTLPYPHTDVEYGLGNHGDVSHPVRGRGHDGGLPGFVSSLRYFPELGVGYVILLDATHSFHAFDEIRGLVFAYLARDRAMPPPPVAARSATDLDGRFFAFANPRHAVLGFIERALLGWRAAETEGGVRLDPLLGDSGELVPTADGGYRLPSQSGTSVRFTNDRDGDPVMISEYAYGEAAPWLPARTRALAIALAYLLLQLAPIWAAGTLAIGNLRRRRVVALELVMWPAVAGLCMIAFPRLFFEAAIRQVLGDVHPLTVAIYLTTLGFAFASIAGFVAVVRWSRRPERPSWLVRLVPTVTIVAAFALTLWLGANGFIGLRTWAW